MQESDLDHKTRARISAVYETEGKRFLAKARRGVRNTDDAEDIVQEVFGSALASITSLANVQNIAAWIFTGIRNRLVDYWRAGIRKEAAGRVTVSREILEEICEAGGLAPLDQFLADEMSEVLAEAVDALPEEQRLVIKNQVFEGLNFRELSEACGVPVNTLAGRKRYALKALAAALRDYVDEGENYE